MIRKASFKASFSMYVFVCIYVYIIYLFILAEWARCFQSSEAIGENLFLDIEQCLGKYWFTASGKKKSTPRHIVQGTNKKGSFSIRGSREEERTEMRVFFFFQVMINPGWRNPNSAFRTYIWSGWRNVAVAPRYLFYHRAVLRKAIQLLSTWSLEKSFSIY